MTAVHRAIPLSSTRVGFLGGACFAGVRWSAMTRPSAPLGAPSTVEQKQLDELSLKIDIKEAAK